MKNTKIEWCDSTINPVVGCTFGCPYCYARAMNKRFLYVEEHIRHAYDFVREDGILITICSAGILTKSTKQGKAFAQWFDEVGGYDYALPQNSFKESGTSVSTKMLVFSK